jgi:hypothetical protein
MKADLFFKAALVSLLAGFLFTAYTWVKAYEQKAQVGRFVADADEIFDTATGALYEPSDLAAIEFYNNLSASYELPSYETFMQNMLDTAVAKRLHTGILKDKWETLEDFDDFYAHMGFGVKRKARLVQEPIIGDQLWTGQLPDDWQTEDENSKSPSHSETQASHKQSTNDWQTIYVKGLGQIKMPPTLEVQAGSYQSLAISGHNYRAGQEYVSDRLVFNQKGLNNKESESYDTYVRVMLSTERDKAGTFGSFTQKLNPTAEEIKDADAAYLEEARKSLQPETRLVKWLGVTQDVVNGMNCYKISYQRQQAENPVVLVSTYFFEDDDKMHILTMSFRTSEAERWESTLNTMKSTFRIDK